ncbi:MAG: SDR family NAD(P)-dependent oxidoreductase [Anaerolineaceae bacterium]|nr:SDR family NAD(P)-dependent oxidoreductase [Anaerolineaceae bacterium]
MSSDLSNKVALVTGGGRGIGRAVCLALGAAGARVVVAARTRSQIQAVASEINASGGRAVAVVADLADEAAIVALFAKTRKQFDRLDVCVNNAGIGRFALVAELTAADIDQVLAVNLRGALLCCREAMKIMIPQGSGYIINISSVVGFKGYPRQSVYTASKHGLMGLTRSLAVEAQEHGIRVSAVLPGGVDTELVGDARPDLNRDELLQPEDIAQGVTYLLSLSDRAAVDQLYIRRRTSRPF